MTVAKPTPAPSVSTDDDDDDLPAPGKVWDNSGPSLSELLKQQEAKEQAAPVVAAPVVAASPNVEPVDASDLDGVMNRLRAAIHRKSPGIDGFLVHGKFAGVEDGVALISYAAENETCARMLDRNGKKEVIQSELSTLLGEQVGVKFRVEEPSADAPPPAPSKRAAPAREPARPTFQSAPPMSQAAAGIPITPELREQLRQTEPLVKALMEELGAEIVRVTPADTLSS